MIVIAVVKSVETTLTKQRDEAHKRARKGFIPLFISVILFILGFRIAFPFIFLSLMYAAYQLRGSSRLRYGIQGEKAVLKALEGLSDEYLIYNDLTIHNGEHKAQIDHLVVSPYGMFCIETKNMKGVIAGNEDDQYWTQMKVGRRGGRYSKQFYNPCKQSVGHVNALKVHFKKVGIGELPIAPMVVFVRRFGCSVCVNTKKTPVIKIGEVLGFIRRFNKNIINKETLEKIGKTLEKSIK